MSSKIQELIHQKQLIEKAIQDEKLRQKSEGVEKVKAIIAEYDLDIQDIFPGRGMSKSKTMKSHSGKVAPKYRNPENGESWTGRGKPPLWIAGKNRDAFRI